MFEAGSKEEFLKHNVSDLYQDPDKRKEFSEKISVNGYVTGEELQLKTLKGRLLWGAVTATMKKDENGDIYFDGMVEDITARKLTEKALRDSERFLTSIVENIPAMIFVKDAAELRFVKFNRAGEELLGYKREDLYGKNDYDFFPKEEAAFFVRKDRDVLAGKTLLDILEEPIHTALKGLRILHTKKIPILDDFGNPLYLLGISEDITEQKQASAELEKYKNLLEKLVAARTEALLAETEVRKKAEVELLRQKQLLDNIIDLNPYGIQIYDRDGHHLRANKAHFELFKSLPRPGYNFFEDPIAAKAGMREKNLQVKEGKVHKAEPMWYNPRWLSPDLPDKLICFRSVVFPIMDSHGQMENFAVMFEDVTDRMKAEQELEKYRKHLEELVNERTYQLQLINEELEAFSYSVSHDLRAPLRTIDGFSQALEEDFGGKIDDQGRNYLGRIRGAAQHMAQLIDDLLQLSRIARSSISRRSVNLSRIASAVADELKAGGPGRNVEFVIQQGITATGDDRLLSIAIEHLLDNAWKFTDRRENARIEFGVTSIENKPVYFVRDSGAGFDMKYADKLFVPFQRLHRQEEFPGIGIGLTIVRRIVRKHGGRIWAEGQPDKGATFYFTLG
jgi:PAS domain S-box-containing protein